MAKGRLLFDEQARERRRWMLFAAGACVLAGGCMLFGIGQTYQLKIQDLWYSVRGDRRPSPQIAIVGIDGKALNAEPERWPWPRDTYVPLIEKLTAAGAKVIGFDIAFSKTTAEDDALAAAMRAAGNVVFGMVFNDAGDPSPPSGVPPNDVIAQAVPPFDVPFLHVIPAPGVEPPSPVLAGAAAAIGHVVLLPSIDGTLRRVPTIIQHGDRAYPALAMQMARVYTGVAEDDVEVTADTVRVGYADIPILQTGQAQVNWPGRDLRVAYPTYSVADVLRGDIGERELEGKAVLVAMTAEGLDDREFPFGLTLPGVLLHATVLDNFFTLTFLKTPGWGIGLELGLFLLFSVLAILVFPRLSTPVLLTAAPVLIVAVLGFSMFAFVTLAVWWPPLYPCLAILFPFASTVFFKLRSTEREKEVEVAKVRETEEKLVEAELEKGLAFQEKGSLDLAIATFHKLPMNDLMKSIYLNLGFDFQNRGSLEKAFLCYKRVYDLDPTFEDVASRIEAMRQAGVGTQLAAGHSLPSILPNQLSAVPTPTPLPPPTELSPDETGTLVLDDPDAATLAPGGGGTVFPEQPSVAATGGGVRPVPGLEPQPGTPGSRYSILQKLGKGAMGEVSLGEDTKLGRKVAIKTIRPDIDLSSREAIDMRQRFVREAQTAGKLTHPNIVTVYDSFEGAEGTAYIVMEYVEGDTLANIIKKQQLTVPQVKHVIVNAANGLQHAHENGVFHRDVKPENIMIAPKTGVTKLMDFGIARLVESNMTATGSVLGTPAYMAPEQVAGKKVDARSDVFSLAVVLYELLVGKRPFTGSSFSQLMMAILQEDPPAPSTVDPARAVSPEWNAVVLKGLAKKPDDRYASAAEFANAVRAVRAK